MIDVKTCCYNFWKDFNSNYISSYLDIPKENCVLDLKKKTFVIFRNDIISKVEQERLKRFLLPYTLISANSSSWFKGYEVKKNKIIVFLNET